MSGVIRPSVRASLRTMLVERLPAGWTVGEWARIGGGTYDEPGQPRYRWSNYNLMARSPQPKQALDYRWTCPAGHSWEKGTKPTGRVTCPVCRETFPEDDIFVRPMLFMHGWTLSLNADDIGDARCAWDLVCDHDCRLSDGGCDYVGSGWRQRLVADVIEAVAAIGTRAVCDQCGGQGGGDYRQCAGCGGSGIVTTGMGAP